MILRFLKIILIVAVILVITISIILLLLSMQPFVPNNYTQIVKTGGELEAKYLAMGASQVEHMEVSTEEEWGNINVYYPKELTESAKSYPVVVMVNAAYEWMFCGHDDFSTLRMSVKDGKVVQKGTTGTQTEQQKQISRELKALFPAYLNGLDLKAADGTPLTLNEDGTGSFLEALKNAVRESAQRELDTHATINNLSWLAVKGSEVERQGYLTIENGKVTGIDWNAFISAIMRMKTAPAFDALDLASPENEEFGSVVLERRHFTAYSQTHDTAGGTLAEPELIAKMNPLTFIGNADTAPYWRIRHGAYDRDTALAIPYILQTVLKNKGYKVDFAIPWGLPHSGDYDLNELFSWIDGLCQKSSDL